MPFIPWFLPTLIVLLTFSTIAGLALGHFRINSSALKSTWPFLGLFAVLVVSLLYSEDTSHGLATLENKLSLVLFPFILLPVLLAGTKFKQYFFAAFITGCVLAIIAGIAQGIANYIIDYQHIQNGLWNWGYGINWFLSSRFTVFLHPSYLAMYLNFSLFLLIREESAPSGWIHLKTNWRRGLILLFLTIQVLLISKAGLFIAGLLFVWWVLMLFRNGSVRAGVALSSMVVLATIALFWKAPELSNRIVNMAGFFDEKESDSGESNDLRVMVWNEALQLSRENMVLGVGIGDVRNELNERYERAEMKEARERNLNAHSQFIQFHLSAGLAAVFLFVMCFIEILASRKGMIGAVFLAVLLISNMLVESMLETQAGMVFFALFGILFIYLSKTHQLVES